MRISEIGHFSPAQTQVVGQDHHRMQIWRDAALGVCLEGGALLCKPQDRREGIMLRHRVSRHFLCLAYALRRVVFAQSKPDSPAK